MVLAWKAYVLKDDLKLGVYVDKGAWMYGNWSSRFEGPVPEINRTKGFKFADLTNAFRTN